MKGGVYDPSQLSHLSICDPGYCPTQYAGAHGTGLSETLHRIWLETNKKDYRYIHHILTRHIQITFSILSDVLSAIYLKRLCCESFRKRAF